MTGVTTSSIVAEPETRWAEAISHPFLDRCADGTITREQFDRWLVQDSLFVLEFARCLARTTAASPPGHLLLLLQQMAVLQGEIVWFRDKLSARGVDPATPPSATCATYIEFMRSLGVTPYPVQVAAAWAIGAAYNQGWSQAGPMAAPYDEYAARWGDAEYGHSLELLAAQADDAIATASPFEVDEAIAAVRRVSALERDFWDMAFGSHE